MKTVSKKHLEIEDSLTLAINAKAKALQKAGESVISFASGEPDFKAPAKVQNAAIEAIQNKPITYTATPGLPELRSAIKNHLKSDFALDYETQQILVTNGAKQALYNALQVLCEPGDEVIVFKPYWVSYIPLIKLAGAKPLIIKSDDTYQPSLSALREAITKNTKAIILNSPNNPTGAVYDHDVLETIASLSVEHGIYLISDEIYAKLTFNATHQSPLNLVKAAYKNTLLINGFSKAYAMTGYRIGYVAGPEALITTMKRLQAHATSNVNTIAQYAALAAMHLDDTAIEPMVEAYKHRRHVALKLFKDMPLIDVFKPSGAFYLWLNIKKIIGKHHQDTTIKSAYQLAELLLEKAHIALVPGEAFGAEYHLRLSIATSEENIREGLKRLKSFIDMLK